MNAAAAASLVLILTAATAHPLAASAADAKAIRLMAACREATGGSALDRPEAFRERGVMLRDEQSGAYETYGDMRSLRSAGSQTFNGQTRWAGFDGAASWRLGPDGKVTTVTDEQTLRGERLGAYLTLSGYLYPRRFPATFQYKGRRRLKGRGYDVVLATPKDADRVELWLDAKTHRLAHVEMTAGGERVVGDVSDYRRVAGTWVGYRLDLTDNGHTVSLRLTDFDYVPLSDAHLSPSIAR